MARQQITDLEGQLAVSDERVAAAVDERNAALELKAKTQKDLDLKTFALKRSQKMSQLERRTNEGLLKKNQMTSDELDAERRDHRLTTEIREKVQQALDVTKEDNARERELRLIGMHRHKVRSE